MTYNKWTKHKILYDKNNISYIKMNKKRVNIDDIIITDREKDIAYIPYQENTLYFIKAKYGINDYIELKKVF